MVAGLMSVGAESVGAATWTANSVAEITQRLKDIKDDGVYTIVWGDTLSAISQASGVTIADSADANKIDNIDLIYAGDTLIIDRDKVTELLGSNSYVNFKENKVKEDGSVEVGETKNYETGETKPSETNKELFEDLQKQVEEKQLKLK